MLIVVGLLPAVFLLARVPISRADELAYLCGEDICLLNPDTASRSDLTETAGTPESHPAWSPNGKLIAYQATYPEPGNTTSDIWEIDPTKPGNATDVSNDSVGREAEPTFSPNGGEIAFIREASSNVDIDIAPADGSGTGEAVGATAVDELNPAWSADSTKLAFNRLGSEAIWVAPAVGGATATALPNAGGFQPVYSPDGASIAAERENKNPFGLRINGAAGGNRELAKPVDLGSSIDWSCDSKRVTFVADEEPNLDQVWVAPADGANVGVQIPMPTGWIVPHHPRFSPDGTRIVFDARPSSGPNQSEQLLVAPANGSAAATPITTGTSGNSEAEWRPTGAACAAGGGPIPTELPPGTSPGPGAGTGTGGKGGGETHPPVVVKLAYFNHPAISGGFMGAAGIDCNVPGGHPTGKILEICEASGNAYAQGVAPQGHPRVAGRAGPKKVLFAAGSVRVKAGKKGKLELKITAAGKKLLVPGRKLKLTLDITTRNGGSKGKKSSRVVTVEVPKKHK